MVGFMYMHEAQRTGKGEKNGPYLHSFCRRLQIFHD